MLRTSSYAIYVDLPDNESEMLLVHGYTGAYDRVSRRVATYLRSLEFKNPPKPLYGDWSPEAPVKEEVIPPSSATIQLLKKRGYLTDMTQLEEEEFFIKTASKLHHLQRLLMPTYVLMPTYSCNLRCPYCFQDEMRTNPKFKHLLRTISPEMVDRILAAMPQIERGHGVPENAEFTRNITFFGGEPLLAESRDIIRYIIERSQSLNPTQFLAVSNATELEAYRDLLSPDKISFLQITLDGAPDEHDRRRIYPDGSGTFAKICQNISMALDLGVSINLRLNIDRNNIDRLPEVADIISERGWNKYSGFSAYTAPIHASNEKTDRRTTFNSWELDLALNEMRHKYSQMKVIRRPDDGLMDRARQIFERRADPLPNLKASFCGAHNKMYVFDPFGDIYACWEKTGDKKIRIGYINENSEVILNEELNQTWRNRTVVTNPSCRKCRYAFSCGGGCAVLAMNNKGNFHANYCDNFANRFRACVAEAYQDFASGETVDFPLERLCAS